MKPLPIGVDDFEKLITKGYYYVDKTMMIKEFLDDYVIGQEEAKKVLAVSK